MIYLIILLYHIVPHVYEHTCFIILCQFLCFQILASSNPLLFCFWQNIWKHQLPHPFLQFVALASSSSSVLSGCLLLLGFSFTHPFILLCIIAPWSDMDFLYHVALCPHSPPPPCSSFTQGILDFLDCSLSVFLLQNLIFSQQPLKFVTCLFDLYFAGFEMLAVSVGIIVCREQLPSIHSLFLSKVPTFFYWQNNSSNS